MSEVKQAYFIAKGRSLEAVLAWAGARKVALDAMTLIFRESGAVRARGQGSSLAIEMAESKAEPTMPGWRRAARSSYVWIVDRKTPEGKSLAKRLGSIHIPSGMSLNVGCSDVVGDGMRLHSAFPEQIGEVWVIAAPYLKEADLKRPWDAEPIKTSQYWAMKEASEPAQAES